MFFRKPKLTGRVSICIPTMFDSRYIIELCLKSIKKYSDYPDYQIIVCDAGVDEATKDYLLDLVKSDQIKLIKAMDWQRPKDDLVRAVDTEYYILLHDDIQMLKFGWLTRRLELIQRSPKNAIVGSIVKNYSTKRSRFFPLGLLVRTDMSRELGLTWGKQSGYDTGGLAYEKFFSQKEYKFVPYKVSRDIRHFSEMTWPKYHTAQTFPGINEKLIQREQKIEHIRKLLASGKY